MSDIDVGTPEGRARLREILDRVPPGPWYSDGHMVWGKREDNDGIIAYSRPITDIDPDFIATARTALPALIDQVELLRGELEKGILRLWEIRRGGG